MQTDDVT